MFLSFGYTFWILTECGHGKPSQLGVFTGRWFRGDIIDHLICNESWWVLSTVFFCCHEHMYRLKRINFKILIIFSFTKRPLKFEKGDYKKYPTPIKKSPTFCLPYWLSICYGFYVSDFIHIFILKINFKKY